MRKFYESFCSSFGQLHKFAEDVKVGNRDNQRTNEVWMEVRFDPNFKDAYDIHLQNNLYNRWELYSKFPNATLSVCCEFKKGGETIFRYKRFSTMFKKTILNY